MTTDPFTDAARAEAEARYPRAADGRVPQDRWPFKIGAGWARAHLAAQEPTDAEVEAAARAIHEHFPRKYVDEFGFTCTARWEELEPHMRDEYRVVARAARRDEETR